MSRRPWDALRIVLAAVMLTAVWRVQDLFPGLSSLMLPTSTLLALLGLMVLSPRERSRALLISRSGVMRAMYVIVALSVLSLPTSLWFGMSAEYLVKHMIPTTLLAIGVAAAVYTVSDVRRVAAIQVAGAIIYALVILTQFEVVNGRLGSLVYYDANDLGMLMVCTLPVALYFVGFAPNQKVRMLALGAIVLFLATIAKSGSRGAFVALLGVAGYMLFRYTTVRWSTRVLTAATVTLLFGGIAGAQYWTFISTLLHPTSDYNWIGNTDGGRMAVWKRGLDYMAQRPLTGVGLAAFPIAEGTISPLAERQTFGRGVKWSAAHNAFIQIGAELGVLAIIVWSVMVFGGLFTAGRLARDALARGERGLAAFARAQGASMIGFIVAAVFLSQAYAPFLYATLGVIVGLDTAARFSWRRAALEEEQFPVRIAA